MTITVERQISDFVRRTDWQILDASLAMHAKHLLLNVVATAIAGSHERFIRTALTSARLTGRQRSDTVVLGHVERADMYTAAFLNAAASNIHDFDDNHGPTVMHPTGISAFALLALAEQRPIKGKDFLAALVAGIEIACRIGAAISPAHYAKGWHITSTCGIFGAACSVSKILNLDATQTNAAFGLAATQSSGLVENLGTSSKSMSVGNAARNGLNSAILASAGVDGPAQPLSGARGFFAVHDSKPGRLTDGLGQHWMSKTVACKPYPVGVVLNPVIQALLELLRIYGDIADQVERVELRGNPLLRMRTDRPLVTTGRESQVSAQHTIAIVLQTGKAKLAQFSDDAAALTYANRPEVIFRDDKKMSTDTVSVTIHTRKMGELKRTVHGCYGSESVPLSEAAIRQKLIDAAKHSGMKLDTHRIADEILGIDRTDNVSKISALLVPR